MEYPKAISQELILNKIHEVRGIKVILDKDLAELYHVETKNLKRAVRRNIDIFPDHFMFELTEVEYKSLRCQIGTSKQSHGGTRYLPMVFTEHGIIHAAHVLRSSNARKMSIYITETFIQMREYLLSHQKLFNQLEKLNKKVDNHEEHIDIILKYLEEFRNTKRKQENLKNRPRIGYK